MFPGAPGPPRAPPRAGGSRGCGYGARLSVGPGNKLLERSGGLTWGLMALGAGLEQRPGCLGAGLPEIRTLKSLTDFTVTPAWDMRGSPGGFPGSRPQLWSRTFHQNPVLHSQSSRSPGIPSVIQQTFVAVDTEDTVLNKADSVLAPGSYLPGGDGQTISQKPGRDTGWDLSRRRRKSSVGTLWSLPGRAASPLMPPPGFRLERALKL